MSFQDFQKAPNRLTLREIGLLLLAGLIILLVLYGLGAGNYFLANNLPDGGEFYLIRISGRSFLFDRIEPYSASVPERVQERVYDGPVAAGEDLYILDIPFHLLILFFPLAVIPDALIARAFWMALSEVAFAGFLYLGFRLVDRRIPLFFIILISVGVFTSYYSFQSFLEGSPVFLRILAYVGIILSLRAGFDELSGALLVLSAFHWESGGLFWLFTILWVIWERRWRVLSGAGMLFFVLLVISLFLYPSWFMPFLRAVWNNIQAGIGFSTHEILGRLWPEYGRTLGWIITLILFFSIGYAWRSTRGDFNRFVWASCLTLTTAPLLGQNVELDQLVLLALPVILVLLVVRERWRTLGNVIAFLLVLFFFGIPWLLFTRGVPEAMGLQMDEALFLFWPIFALIGLYWVRWWMIRPPRTWLERVTEPMR